MVPPENRLGPRQQTRDTIGATSFPGPSLFLPRGTLGTAIGHVELIVIVT